MLWLNYVIIEVQDNLITDFFILIDYSLYNLKFKNTFELYNSLVTIESLEDTQKA